MRGDFSWKAAAPIPGSARRSCGTIAGTANVRSGHRWLQALQGGPCTGRLAWISAILRISRLRPSACHASTSTPFSGIDCSSCLVSPCRGPLKQWARACPTPTPPLPVGLDALVGMGMNRVKLAIAVALAEHGGCLSTLSSWPRLARVAATTIARNLNELETTATSPATFPATAAAAGTALDAQPSAPADLRALIEHDAEQARMPTASLDRQPCPGTGRHNLIVRVGSRPVAPEGYLRNSRPNPSPTRLDGPEGPTGGLMNNQAARHSESQRAHALRLPLLRLPGRSPNPLSTRNDTSAQGWSAALERRMWAPPDAADG